MCLKWYVNSMSDCNVCAVKSSYAKDYRDVTIVKRLIERELGMLETMQPDVEREIMTMEEYEKKIKEQNEKIKELENKIELLCNKMELNDSNDSNDTNLSEIESDDDDDDELHINIIDQLCDMVFSYRLELMMLFLCFKKK